MREVPLVTLVTRVTPIRTQRRRTKGWRMPENAVYVGRPSRWGNPFVDGRFIALAASAMGVKDWADAAVILHRAWVSGAVRIEPLRGRASIEFTEGSLGGSLWIEGVGRYDLPKSPDLSALRGHDLACWCDLSAPCHADVLLELANR